jgi:hypothetical protein
MSENEAIKYYREDMRARMRHLIANIGIADFLETVAEALESGGPDLAATDVSKIVNHLRRLEAQYDGSFRRQTGT